MATRGAMAEMDKAVRNRLMVASATLQARFGIAPSAPPPYVRDPELQRIQQLETLADLLESVAVATEPKQTAANRTRVA